MLKKILKLDGAQQLSSDEQKSINGGARPCYYLADGTRYCPPPPGSCGGDGSFIFVNGVKTCCYLPATNNYLC
jgi:hypothetical protein